jgi:hypothetical protein
MFLCPNCSQVVGEYPDAGVEIVVCPACTYKYEVSGGTVASFTSRGVEVRPAMEGRRAQYARDFELIVTISPRERLRFSFVTERDDEWIHIAKGDEVAVVYGMRKARRETLLFIVNRHTSARFVLGTPDSGTKNRAALIGAGAAILGGGAALMLAVPPPVMVLLTIGMAAGAFLAAKPMLRPTHELQSGERAELSARASLLEEKRGLPRLRAGVSDEMSTRVALRRQLDDLRTRMVAVQIDAYASRIAATEKALAGLDEQLDMDRRLLAEYDRTIEILDIEHDASKASDAIPADAATFIETRRAELRAAEELRAETTRRLSANAEVEALLGGG